MKASLAFHADDRGLRDALLEFLVGPLRTGGVS